MMFYEIALALFSFNEKFGYKVVGYKVLTKNLRIDNIVNRD